MWPFGRKFKALDYAQAQPFIEPTLLAAPLNNRVPMDAYLGWTGQLVRGTLNAVNPAVQIPVNNQIVAGVAGAGVYFNDLPVQQMLTQKPEQTGSL